jgi:tripartite-type tricarboxylate transporter receptor subunit TctC
MLDLVGRRALLAMGLAIAAVAGAQGARADAIEEFYRGKTMEMIVPTSPGGDYDLRARMVARYLTKFIPGNPVVIVRNMPGGLGIAAANYMTKSAARDGTVLHAIFQNMPSLQAIGTSGVDFDVRRFGWIGNTTDSPNVINSWYTTGIKTIQDVMTKELIVGAPGAASTSYVYPAALNALVGTKFKIVTGYPGGNDVNLAMEKGEVGGRGSNSWASWKSGHPQWLAEKKIFILVQIGLKRAVDLPDVPLMSELAKTDEDRQVLTFMSADMGISRAFVTTPDVPADRLAALRKAFAQMIEDKEFLAEADKVKMDISPSDGQTAQKVAESMLATPKPILARAKVLMEGGSK